MSEITLLHVPRQLVVFRVGATSYGIAIDAVEEILPLLPVTSTPGAPRGVLGLANIHKRVAPVFDLHERFGIERPADSSETRLILVSIEDTAVALLVDEVDEVLTVRNEDVQPGASLGATAAVDYLRGVVREGDRLLLWVDHTRLAPPAVRNLEAAA